MISWGPGKVLHMLLLHLTFCEKYPSLLIRNDDWVNIAVPGSGDKQPVVSALLLWICIAVDSYYSAVINIVRVS